MALSPPLLAGFAFLAFGAVLAIAGVALAEDEPAIFGMFSAGVGLLVILVGLVPARRPS